MYKKVKIHFCQFHASPYPSSTFEIKSLDQKKKSSGLGIMCVQDFFDSEFLQKCPYEWCLIFVSIAQRNWGSCKMYFFFGNRILINLPIWPWSITNPSSFRGCASLPGSMKLPNRNLPLWISHRIITTPVIKKLLF